MSLLGHSPPVHDRGQHRKESGEKAELSLKANGDEERGKRCSVSLRQC